MSDTLEIPGIDATLKFTPPGLISGFGLSADGEPLPQSRGVITLPDGRTATLKPQWNRTLPTLIIGEERYEHGEAIPIFLVILQFLPLFLLAAGGCLGGAFGGVGLALNMMVNRKGWPVPLKAGAMVGITGLVTAVWLGIVVAITV